MAGRKRYSNEALWNKASHHWRGLMAVFFLLTVLSARWISTAACVLSALLAAAGCAIAAIPSLSPNMFMLTPLIAHLSTAILPHSDGEGAGDGSSAGELSVHVLAGLGFVPLFGVARLPISSAAHRGLPEGSATLLLPPRWALLVMQRNNKTSRSGMARCTIHILHST